MVAKLEIENVNHPGVRRAVDAQMYAAMKQALLKVLPARPPGATLDEVRKRLPRHLPERLYPGGAKAGWWAKAVQLDLEAKGAIVRERVSPVRLHRA